MPTAWIRPRIRSPRRVPRSRSRRRLHLVATALLALATGLFTAVPAGASVATPVQDSTPAQAAVAGLDGVRADDGAEVTGVTVLDDRTVDLTVASPALGGDGHARVLLPPDHARQPHRSWPTLYLLHGCCDGSGVWDAWSRRTDVAALTAGTDALIVMPLAGYAGFYSDWWNHGAGSAPAWETFHLTELRQLLERSLRANDHRAVAGLSMGGFGALSYAARHPRMFRAAASFSGVLDTRPAEDAAFVQSLVARTGADPLALWGDPVAQEDIWRAHNPTDLAARLRGTGTRVYVACGDGQPGPLDPPGAGVNATEVLTHRESLSFVAAAQAAHVPVVTDFYGAGTHSWPYWERALHRSFPMLMASIGAAPAGQ